MEESVLEEPLQKAARGEESPVDSWDLFCCGTADGN